MPSLSLVVCLHEERDYLERLLHHCAGLYDDLVVVHDGPDPRGIRSVVEAASGRFFERPRAFQQEPHWPFAWQQAACDWILRLDADEFPSQALKLWLQQFRAGPDPKESIAGYTCIWPIWNGRKAISRKWPNGRQFLFHKQRVRFFGMAEQVPCADGRYESLDLVLEHQPNRKTHSVGNILLRKQSYRWRERIAHSLLGNPSDLNCWRWQADSWPPFWEEIRRQPLRTALRRLAFETLRGLRAQWKAERRFFPGAAISGPLHHALLCLRYSRQRRGRQPASPAYGVNSSLKP